MENPTADLALYECSVVSDCKVLINATSSDKRWHLSMTHPQWYFNPYVTQARPQTQALVQSHGHLPQARRPQRIQQLSTSLLQAGSPEESCLPMVRPWKCMSSPNLHHCSNHNFLVVVHEEINIHTAAASHTIARGTSNTCWHQTETNSNQSLGET